MLGLATRVTPKDFFGNKKYCICPHCTAVNTVPTSMVKLDRMGYEPIIECITCNAELQIAVVE